MTSSTISLACSGNFALQTRESAMRRSWIAVVTVLLALGAALTWLASADRSEPESRSQSASTFESSDTPPGESRAVVPASTDQDAEYMNSPNDRVFRDFESNIKAEAVEWVNGLFITNTRGMNYDRVRLVDIDWFNLLQPIKSSQFYLQSSSGATIPEKSGDSSNSFYIEPFSDKKYQMIIERVDVYETNGVHGIALLGSTLDAEGRQGTWQLSIDENERSLSGHINAPDGYTTFGPGPDNAFHVFREVSQESRRQQMEGKTY
jgi:hypothetical protein